MSNVDELYDALLNSGLTESEIKNEMQKKERDYGGYLTTEALLFVIAKERGLNLHLIETYFEIEEYMHENVDYCDFESNIADLSENTDNVVISGRIETIYGIKEFTRKDGTIGMVGSFVLRDKTGKIKVTLWDRQVEIMRNDYIKPNEIVRIIGAYAKKGTKGILELQVKKKGFLEIAPQNVKKNEIPPLINKNYLRQKYIQAAPKITRLFESEGFYEKIIGIVENKKFGEKNLKSGDKSFLLSIFLCNNDKHIEVVVWGIRAVECFKMLDIGDKISLSNVLVKKNQYTGLNQIKITKKTVINKIQ
ncbi:MAG: hypothetical protein JW891_06235 [Candidatus Lokiarchaeota archaeon]|nr:hypothetical protein [Candidatus Lokiarchaeota archaeon]